MVPCGLRARENQLIISANCHFDGYHLVNEIASTDIIDINPIEMP